MKTLRQARAVVVLTLLLSASTFAGQVNCPGVADPPPPPTSETTTTATATDSLTTSIILVIVSLIP
jgi:hypothetical protein